MTRPSTCSRVYFIGAGFSAGMQYPVGQTLMPRLIAYLRNKPEAMGKRKARNSVHDEGGSDRARKVARVFNRVLKTYFAAKPSQIGRVDLAEFYTLAQALSERSWLGDGTADGKHAGGATVDEPSEATLFADLAAATRSLFVDLSRYNYPGDIDSVLRLVDTRRHAIVNFNWDEQVDLWFSTRGDAEVSYTLGAWRSDPGALILKPHGSVGWYDLQRGIGNEDAYLIARSDKRVPRYDKRILAYYRVERPRDVDGKTFHPPLACPPVITAPTFGKRFDYVEQQRTWLDVLEVCRGAGEFVFLGYSLPKDDFLTRAAIRAAMSTAQRRARIRCLVVDRSFDKSKLANFESVFEGMSVERNYLEWSFGSGGKKLATAVRAKLPGARVGKSKPTAKR